jgi:hypothetical protein
MSHVLAGVPRLDTSHMTLADIAEWLFHKGDIVRYGPGMTRFEVVGVEDNRVRIQYPALGYQLVKDASLLTLVQAAPRVQIAAPAPVQIAGLLTAGARPLNPVYISVKYTDITPGDVLEQRIVLTTTRNGAVYTAARKTVASVSDPYRKTFMCRDVMFTDGSHMDIGELDMVSVYAGPKWQQRNNAGVVEWLGGIRFIWRGYAQEGAAA